MVAPLELFVVLVIQVILGLTGTYAAPRAAPAGGLDLLVLHTNDMHARFEQTNKFSGTCSEWDEKKGQCYGGYARVATLFKQARAEESAGGPPVLVLNAGDNYQGTIYYTLFKWRVAAYFTNLLNFTALSLGNHEFDDHVKGLVPFLKEVKSPVVTANIDTSDVPELQGLNLKPSVVVDVKGTKVGVIGYLTPETAFLSQPDKVKFRGEVEVLTEEAQRLKAQGVNIIIALGHSGYDVDQVIAAQVPHLDLVIGGHSHSFLYTGPHPDVDVPVGLYPTMVKQPSSGRMVPVVQAYAFTKYMGRMRLAFDANGELVDIKGEPQLLNNSVEQDAETLAEVEKWKKNLDSEVSQPVGKTEVPLDATKCRSEECNLGNLIADAFVSYRAEQWRGEGWTDAPIGIENGGAIRTSVDASSVNGTLTVKDMMEILPFENINVLLKIKGTALLEAMEHAVASYVPGSAWRGAFLQVSGLRVRYDLGKPPGKRVTSLKARCGNCTIPRYSPVRPDEVYGVIVNGFLANGGDGFTMFADHQDSLVLQDTEMQILLHHVTTKSPVYPGVEGRIEMDMPKLPPAPGSASSLSVMAFTVMPSVVVAAQVMNHLRATFV